MELKPASFSGGWAAAPRGAHNAHAHTKTNGSNRRASGMVIGVLIAILSAPFRTARPDGTTGRSGPRGAGQRCNSCGAGFQPAFRGTGFQPVSCVDATAHSGRFAECQLRFDIQA